MKHSLASAWQKIVAFFTTILMFFGGLFAEKEPEKVYPENNTIGTYDEQTADYKLNILPEHEVHDISDILYGVFFEDINFAADAGLYAEKIANRSFEFTALATDDELFHWSAVNGANLQVLLDAPDALNRNNTNYLVMENTADSPAGAKNIGFMEGMNLDEGAKYNFSVWAKGLDRYAGKVYARICVGDEVIDEAVIANITADWAQYALTLESDVTATENVSAQILIDNGKVAVDMVSLFPVDTYKGRENGLRKDLCELLEEMQPKFLRFPGGCVIESYTWETAYHWKDSVGVDENGDPLLFNNTYGDVAARLQGENIWTDHSATEDPYPSFMTYGLGFYEYFLLCEDLGAVAVPVLNCGLYCQMRGMGPVDMNSEEFAKYLDDMFDLIEFCRGDETTVWGKARIAMGHTEPFDLQYICIGNENEGMDYYERYTAFLEAFLAAKAENPEFYEGIELIYSAGAADATHGTNYIGSYKYAKDYLDAHPELSVNDFAGATDQHYYNDPIWFRRNTDYYDEKNYSRTVEGMTDTNYGGAIQVFLGEYAARSNSLEAALAEVAYMTGLERNGDIVRMAAYAPLFSSTTARHWSPNLIWYNNADSIGSISYYAQKLFSTNAGTTLLESTLDGALIEQPTLSGKVGVGTWYTSAKFDNVKVVSNADGKTLGEDDFTLNTFWWNWDAATDGKFKVEDGALVQKTTEMNYSNTGSVAYFGSADWEDYTFTVEATKLEGEEGFIIPFAVQDTKNNFFWNIGGWGNTISCLQQIENDVKTGQMVGTIREFTAETGKTYELKVVVSGRNIKCYIDNELYVDYTTGSSCEAEAYQVVSTDETGDIIVKLVNVTNSPRTFAVTIDENTAIESTATAYQMYHTDPMVENHLGQTENVKIEEITLENISNAFNYTVPCYSATVVRIQRAK
ncbi:MAG: hypothetical protein IKJ63_09620 [Clostridia bacterium]|nr:hypothetical protein [Clostridia bacterium]